MKHINSLRYIVWLLALLFIPFISAQAQEQEPLEDYIEEEEESKVLNPDHDHIIKFKPLDLYQVSFAHEKLRSANVSNGITISYIYKSTFRGSGFVPETKKVNGIGIQMSQRHYTTRKRAAPFGFFHGPVFAYRFLLFDKNVFGQEDIPTSDPNYRYIGRLTQHSIDLAYQVGSQYQLGEHFTLEIGAGLGGRLKYANAENADELLTQNIIGHTLKAESSAAVFWVPLPQLNFSVGYSF